MKEINVLLTSVGGLIAPGIIKNLKAKGNFFIVGIDANDKAIGFNFCDDYYQVPYGNSPKYLDKIISICDEKKIDVIIPASDEESLTLSKNRKEINRLGIKLLAPKFEAIEYSNDKGKMLSFLKKKNIEVPEYYLPKNIKDFKNAVNKLGYPQKKVVLKPRKGRGGRGVRVLSDEADLLTSRYVNEIRLEHVLDNIKSYSEFPDIVLMEYLPGDDYSVDVLADRGETLFAVPRKRIKSLGGPSQEGIILENREIEKEVKEIIKAMELDNNINVQLKYSRENKPLIYEINPRISGTIGFNSAAGIPLLYYGIKKLLFGLNTIPKSVNVNNMKMTRYLKEYYEYGEGEFEIIS